MLILDPKLAYSGRNIEKNTPKVNMNSKIVIQNPGSVASMLEVISHEISLPFTGEYREHLDILAPRATIYLGGLDSDSNFAEHMVAV